MHKKDICMFNFYISYDFIKKKNWPSTIHQIKKIIKNDKKI